MMKYTIHTQYIILHYTYMLYTDQRTMNFIVSTSSSLLLKFGFYREIDFPRDNAFVPFLDTEVKITPEGELKT